MCFRSSEVDLIEQIKFSGAPTTRKTLAAIEDLGFHLVETWK